MKRLRKNSNFLKLLLKTSPNKRRSLLRTANKEQVSCLCEICLNILAGNIPVNIKKIKKFKNVLRKLANPSTKLQTKKNILVNQSGGFLGNILPTIATVLSNILGM